MGVVSAHARRLGIGIRPLVQRLDQHQDDELGEFNVDVPDREQFREFVCDEQPPPAGGLGFVVVLHVVVDLHAIVPVEERVVLRILLLHGRTRFVVFEVQQLELGHDLFVDALDDGEHVEHEHDDQHGVEFGVDARVHVRQHH